MGARRVRLVAVAAITGIAVSACGGIVTPETHTVGAVADRAAAPSPIATPGPSHGPSDELVTASGTQVQAPSPWVETRRIDELRVELAGRIPAPAQPGWTPFAAVGGVTLVHPAETVARIGFHESNHDGARQLEVVRGAANHLTLETRERGTGSRTAADVVVHPDREIRSPVTGTVLRSGTYVLYCEHADDYVVIAPDGRPGWEVKILHISGVQVRAGDRVEAGTTVLAPGATPLPFRSQVDDHT
ncbi:MAG: hypothetical protein R3343_12710, partial [Nitriliruptorales bacterium]|nr:hypothetical protein [Nitriliruptorales bacterium]